MKKFTSTGFGVMPVIFILVVIGILVIVGDKIYTSRKNNDSTSSLSKTLNVESPIKNTQELELVSKDLDTVDVDGELQTSDLENDINLVL